MREGGRQGGREGGREAGREGGREGVMEGGREGGRSLVSSKSSDEINSIAMVIHVCGLGMRPSSYFSFLSNLKGAVK